MSVFTRAAAGASRAVRPAHEHVYSVGARALRLAIIRVIA